MMRTLFLIATIVMMSSAMANIKRSCEGAYWFIKLDGRNSATSFNAGFTGNGGCNDTVPSRCYHRAMANVINCMDTHWKKNDRDNIPYECTLNHGIHDYDTVNLKKEMIDHVCGLYGPGAGTYALYAQSYSDNKEYITKKLLQKSITLDCDSEIMWINE